MTLRPPCFTAGMMLVSRALLKPHTMPSILPGQFNRCFISPQSIFPEALQIADVLFGKLQTCSNAFTESGGLHRGTLPV